MPKILGKNMVLSIALIVLLTTGVLFAMLPKTAATISVVGTPRTLGAWNATSPKLIGLGQLLTCNLVLFPALEDATFYTFGQSAESTGNASFASLSYAATLAGYEAAGYANLTVTFTRPDGTKDVFMPQDTTLKNLNITYPGLTNVMGTLLFYYTPNEVGRWSMSFSFPGETIYDSAYSTRNDSVYYKPVTSSPSYFTVQSAKVNAGLLNGWPYVPLPTGYWTYPVSVNNREWSAISGNWPVDGMVDGVNYAYNEYSMAPTTAHMVWNIYFQDEGGLVGGMWGSMAYNSKVIKTNAPLIWNGEVYITEQNAQYYDVYNLDTGAFLYRSEGDPTFILAIKPPFQTPGQTAGVEQTVQAYLVDTSVSGHWIFWDVNGANKPLYNIINVPSGLASITWMQGSPLVYMCRQWNGWNTTVPLGYTNINAICWSLIDATVALATTTTVSSTSLTTGALSGAITENWLTGVVWNVTVPRAAGAELPGDNLRAGAYRFDTAGKEGIWYVGAVMQPHQLGFDEVTGALLWDSYLSFIPTNYFVCGSGGPLLAINSATATYNAIDPATGAVLWTSTPIMQDSPDWQGIPSYYEYVINMAKNEFYVGSYDGRVYAYNLTTGQITWISYYLGNTSETVYGTWVYAGAASQAGAADELFFASGIVYGAEPFTRWNQLVCLNETTGALMWKLPIIGAQCGAAIAGGYYIMASEDGNFYCFGKGQTQTTVDVSPKVSTSGTSVLISGKCLDMSPAQPGTPAVSDKSMAVWMDYLHLQNATIFNETAQTSSPGLLFNPPTPTGVTVTLTAVDPNNNMITIGTVTTDSSGEYKMLWTPAITGTYTVYATFSGSGSYWSSDGTTAIGVVAATSTAAPTATPTSVANLYFVPAIAGLFVLIIIVAIVLAILMLRKKP